ncbi:single-stranded-DNA-specific exonuclease RecJ [Chloroflexota bacterium]
MSHSRWNLLPAIPEGYLKDIPGFSPIVAQILYNRGLTESSQIESFIAADERLSGDPYLLPDMHRAVSRLYQALLSSEKIAIYGDFDTDGITATALLVQGLSLLDCQAIPYIPNRLTEGYGLKESALENLQQQGVSLVITVDCGITALSQVKRANRLGLDVIITDHHTPLKEIPPAVAVINPKLPDSPYPFSELAGVGVALKLLQALFWGLGKEQQLIELLDLVALGTIADRVPLLGENRYLVRQGLEKLNNIPRIGIREMISRSPSSATSLDSENISWTIAPRLNAAGRMENAMSSYNLLMTDSPEEARELAEWLEQKNTERQKLTVKVLERAREQVLNQQSLPIMIAGDNDFPAGIIGLVAGRLSEEFYRPVIVLRTGDRFSGGSCRSIPEFDIIQALNQCSHLLTHFGGHSRAAGLGLHTRDLPRLRQELLGLATAELDGIDLRPRVDIDAEIFLSNLGKDTFSSIQKLAPFGQDNPAPSFLSRRFEVVDCRSMGNRGDHLRMKLRQDGMVWDGVAFGLGKYLNEVSSHLDLVYNLEINHWNGQENIRLNVADFEKSN